MSTTFRISIRTAAATLAALCAVVAGVQLTAGPDLGHGPVSAEAASSVAIAAGPAATPNDPAWG
ncbi:hypothetical protein [Kitasatospora sp. NPDC088783]|uniref:hypothetical protein n=1 Tax=Kitasatospora sp. NPDC088783 TaxID=3364077 RepID=UPI003815ACC2